LRAAPRCCAGTELSEVSRTCRVCARCTTGFVEKQGLPERLDRAAQASPGAAGDGPPGCPSAARGAGSADRAVKRQAALTSADGWSCRLVNKNVPPASMLRPPAVSLPQRGIRETLPGYRLCAVGCAGEKRRLQSGGCCSARVLRRAGGPAIPVGLHIRGSAADLPGPAADGFRAPIPAARCIQPAMPDKTRLPVSPRSARRHCLA
jgi:hypothetical protein